MIRIRCLLFGVGFILTFNLQGQNPLGEFGGFNVVAEENLSFEGSSIISGPVSIGGNLILNTSDSVAISSDTSGGYFFPGDGSSRTGLLVKGRILWSDGILHVGNQTMIHVQDSIGSVSSDNGGVGNTRVYKLGAAYSDTTRIESEIDQTPSPALFQTVSYDYTGLFDFYRTNSASIGLCAPNVQLVDTLGNSFPDNNVPGGAVVVPDTLIAGANYMSLNTGLIDSIGTLKLNLGNSVSSSNLLILNYSASANVHWNVFNITGSSEAENKYILWNFINETNDTLWIEGNNDVHGTIYAPNMHIVQSGTGTIRGALIGKSVHLNHQNITYALFEGSVPGCAVQCPTISMYFTGQTSIANGGETTLTVTGQDGVAPYTYFWDNGLGAGSTHTVAPTTTTTYTVVVTDADGCTGTGSVTVGVYIVGQKGEK